MKNSKISLTRSILHPSTISGIKSSIKQKQITEQTIKTQPIDGVYNVYKGKKHYEEFIEGEITYQLESNNFVIARYKGEIRNGKRHGKGIYQTQDKSISLQGVFQRDQFVEGKVNRKDCEIQTVIKNEKMLITEAKIIQQNGNYFEGKVDIKDDKLIRKQGTYNLTDGRKITGNFENVRQKWIGEFELTKDGKVNKLSMKE